MHISKKELRWLISLLNDGKLFINKTIASYLRQKKAFKIHDKKILAIYNT